MKAINKYKPAVTNYLLILIAGLVWIGVGLMLVYLAFSWLRMFWGLNAYMYMAGGVVLALLVHHFGFLKLVDKNLKRILPMDGKKCLFAFIPWKSYLTIAVMITLGVTLRHSEIPKQYLAILYTGIGFALILSSVRYLRIFIRELKRPH